jgi:hypothetical protein
MNSTRKADLQRKLSMASVPKPPAGLGERIKQDIPEFLRTEPERQRFTKLLSVNMRVAASILLLVSSTYLCLHILSRASVDRHSSEPMAMASRAAKSIVIPNATPPEARQPVVAPNVPPPAAPEPVMNVAPPPSVAERIVLHRDLSVDAKERKDESADGAVAGRFEPQNLQHQTEADNAVGRRAESVTVTAMAPAAAQAAPAPPPPATVPKPSVSAATPANEAAAQAASYDKVLVQKSARSEMVRSANAADFDLRARDSVFGISVNGNAFEQVKSAIERGERPSNVDVEALINYFAGTAERLPRDVSLEAEGSTAPVDEGERTVFVRYTIDTARGAVAPNASVPPIATNARVDVDFDSQSVASFRRVGGESKGTIETSLLKNVSVTAMYAVQLQPSVTRRMPLATVTLHYNNVTNGREETRTRSLRVGDVTQSWSDASRRHRLASLGAVWGEQLRSATSGSDVARRAEELAKEKPKDERAKELAALANASSR